MFAGEHGCVARWVRGIDTGCQRRNDGIRIGVVKENEGLPPRAAIRIARRVANPVQRAVPFVVRPGLHHVADVDDKRTINCLNVQPIAAFCAHLQPAGLVFTQQDGERSVICVRTRTQLPGLGKNRLVRTGVFSPPAGGQRFGGKRHVAGAGGIDPDAEFFGQRQIEERA